MTIEVTAKKVEEAIKKGLEQLGASLDEVNVEVVESGGLFRKAKVRLTRDDPPAAEATEKQASPDQPAKQDKTVTAADDKPEKQEKAEKPVKTEKTEKSEKADKSEKTEKPEKAEKPEKREKTVKTEKQEKPEKSAAAEVAEEKSDEVKQKQGRRMSEEDEAALVRAVEFIKETVKLMGFDATVERDAVETDKINVTAAEGDDSLIIGRHGETLTALGYLAETGARAEKCHITAVVDCNGYRGRRAASLSAMAHRRADEACAKGRRIKLEAMERIDRRTVHNALGDDDRVTTASEGKEPYRCVVICPKDLNRNKSSHRDRNRARREQPEVPAENGGDRTETETDAQ